MKITIADCDHTAYDEERAVAARFGTDLTWEGADAHTPDEIVARCYDADGIALQYARFDAALMDRLPNLTVLGRYGVGVDSIDIQAATARGIAVCNVPDYGTESVSDHAIALALALLRDIGHQSRLALVGQASFLSARPGHLASASTMGIIGCGLIGSATARKAEALGLRVIVCDILADGPVFHGYPAVSLEDLLAEADIVSLHTPLTDQTYHMIDAAALALMKPTASLVNTARGAVVDTDALVSALQAGHLRGAGLDTLETEPVPVDSPLLACDRVIVTPHIAWYTEETYGVLKTRTIENIATYLSGTRPRDIVNPEILTDAVTLPVPRRPTNP